MQPRPEIALPTTATRAGQGASRLARLSGRLLVDDADCLYLSPPGSPDRIGLIWPAGFTARRRRSDGVVEVLDGDGAVILRDGDVFRVGGGGAAGPAGSTYCMGNPSDRRS